MKNLLIIICVLIVTVTYAQEDPDPASFFPSAVGNVWEYSTPSGSYKSIVIRDSVDTYNNHFLFYDSYFSGKKALYKIDPVNNVYTIHTSIDTILYHYYKLDADSGEVWRVHSDPPGTFARVDKIYTAYLFGEQRYIKEIGFYRPPYPFTDTTITEETVYERYVLLVSGIGEYYEFDYESGPVRILQGCIIDGITYGTVDVNEEFQTVPSEFILYQNYPNPFNPTTNIEYYLPKNENVTLKIYNIIGEEVRKLVEEYQQSGTHKITFNAGGLPSGVYIYTLFAGEQIFSQKMVYVK